MPLNPATTTRIVQVALAAAAAPCGGKQPIYESACAELGISLATLHRHLKKVTMKQERKQRSDAGDVSLSREEAVAISAALMVSQRKNSKRLMSIGQAVELLRANNEIRAERIDEAGEIMPLSDSAIARALRHYSLHPDQLNRPEPAKELRSLHPNHVWQIDASMCVLYYLNTTRPKEAGLQVMDHREFYKNKPANLKRIEADRVWSYEVTDHNSGAIFVHYVLGAESGTNLAEAFIAATQQRGTEPFHGVPFALMMDRGSANTSGLFKNLARRLLVKVETHAPGNARATGQVENARNIIERSFEAGLRLTPVQNLEELNAAARRWAGWYNANKIHSRHGKSRFDQWLTIGEGQLRIAPSVEICRELLTATPETRLVTDQLTVSFRKQEFDVSSVPGVMVGEKLEITRSPYVKDAVAVVYFDQDGREVLHTAPMVQRLDDGFRADANVLLEDFTRHRDTVLETNRKEVERFAFDAETDEEAASKRKAMVTPFGGRIDPQKLIDQAPERAYLPRRGTDLQPSVATASTPVPIRQLTHFQAATELADLGVLMTAERNDQVRGWFPDGVPEDEIESLVHRLSVRASLRVVAGGAAND